MGRDASGHPSPGTLRLAQRAPGQATQLEGRGRGCTWAQRDGHPLTEADLATATAECPPLPWKKAYIGLDGAPFSEGHSWPPGGRLTPFNILFIERTRGPHGNTCLF